MPSPVESAAPKKAMGKKRDHEDSTRKSPRATLGTCSAVAVLLDLALGAKFWERRRVGGGVDTVWVGWLGWAATGTWLGEMVANLITSVGESGWACVGKGVLE